MAETTAVRRAEELVRPIKYVSLSDQMDETRLSFVCVREGRAERRQVWNLITAWNIFGKNTKNS